MSAPQDYNYVQERIQKALVSTVKTVNRIAAEDLTFQRTIHPEVAEQLDDRTERLLDLSTRLLKSAAAACNVSAPKLEDVEDVDMKWRGVVDVVDSVLEKADMALDEYTGLIKRKEPPTQDSGSRAKKPKPINHAVRNANITKPQVHFELKPGNFASGPWKPLLTSKPHAIEPLESSLVPEPNDEGILQYKHPYTTEIQQMQYPKRAYKHTPPTMYQPVDTTSATWVDTYEGVLEMLEELKKAKEIAVDLEHHDFRTYVGIVSLMQVSTREKDWIVDTLQPWRHKLEVLNEVFANPKIIKVFHGAYMDVIWLQRDLGLYLNGLFDTFFACELLYPSRSLAYLLSKFVDFQADKQYQLADWRIRPLPEEMFYYARSDTHYLLYIYDRVRNDLIEASDRSDPDKDYISRALQNSRNLSLSRHEHPGYDESTGQGPRGWYNYVLKHSHMALNSEQFAIFRAVWKWRDNTAKKEDESPTFVLGIPQMTEIARFNPPDVKALHSLLPLGAPLARSRVSEIWELIRQFKTEEGPTLLQFFHSLNPDAPQTRSALKSTSKASQLSGIDGEVLSNPLSQSRLFGEVPVSSLWEESKHVQGLGNERVPFPWQKFVRDTPVTSSSDQQGNGVVTQEIAVRSADHSEKVEDEIKAETDSDPEFTLKKGTKRKLAEAKPDQDSDETSSSGEDESDPEDAAVPSPDDVEAESNLPEEGVIRIDDDRTQKKAKRQRKREKYAQQQSEETQRRATQKSERLTRKEEKRARKQHTSAKDGKAAFNAVPFDYTQAASVLNAARDATGGEGGKEKKEKKKVFDPYASIGEDAMPGARKAPPIKGERSATFRK